MGLHRLHGAWGYLVGVDENVRIEKLNYESARNSVNHPSSILSICPFLILSRQCSTCSKALSEVIRFVSVEEKMRTSSTTKHFSSILRPKPPRHLPCLKLSAHPCKLAFPKKTCHLLTIKSSEVLC